MDLSFLPKLLLQHDSSPQVGSPTEAGASRISQLPAALSRSLAPAPAASAPTHARHPVFRVPGVPHPARRRCWRMCRARCCARCASARSPPPSAPAGEQGVPVAQAGSGWAGRPAACRRAGRLLAVDSLSAASGGSSVCCVRLCRDAIPESRCPRLHAPALWAVSAGTGLRWPWASGWW